MDIYLIMNHAFYIFNQFRPKVAKPSTVEYLDKSAKAEVFLEADEEPKVVWKKAGRMLSNSSRYKLSVRKDADLFIPTIKIDSVSTTCSQSKGFSNYALN